MILVLYQIGQVNMDNKHIILINFTILLIYTDNLGKIIYTLHYRNEVLNL